jgi:hypothetical protein
MGFWRSAGLFGGLSRAFRNARGKTGVGLLPFEGAGRGTVENGEDVSSLADMPRNRAAHHAKAQKRYVEGSGHASPCNRFAGHRQMHIACTA